MNRQRVEVILRQAAAAFDLALEVKQNPSPLDFKLHRHLRPYFVEASQEMIDEGNHREAMFWIMGAYAIAHNAISIDAPPEEQAIHQARWSAILDEMGLDTPESSEVRQRQAQEFSGRISALADTIVASNPDIVRGTR
ncbi:MAG: hypothetical protein HC802_22950 [Caldilineaceae bacterium]|nr:hypothetical protein [Caldilineaceae bacterium]